MSETVQFRRDLTREDLERMRVPPRYWNVMFDGISGKVVIDDEKLELIDVVRKYGERLVEMREKGVGLLFWGINGTGKTSTAVCFAKEYRRRGYTVLFMQAADLKRMVVEKESFDEDESFWERASNVEVLILDDLGKGTMDSKGFGASLIDELIRTRNSNKLVTFITSNLDPREWKVEMDLKQSTLHTMKECLAPIHVSGSDRRIATSDSINEQLFGS